MNFMLNLYYFLLSEQQNYNSRQTNNMLRQRKKRQNHQLNCPFKQNFVLYDEHALKQQSCNSSNLIRQKQPQQMISCQQIKVVSEKYFNQRHFIKTQRPYLLLKDQKASQKIFQNKQNVNTKLSLRNLTINPKQGNMFMSNINYNKSLSKLRKFSTLKCQRPKSVSSFQLDRSDVKILQETIKRHDKISASKALILFSQILKNQKISIPGIRKKNIGQNRYKSVNVLANKVLITQKQQPKKKYDLGMKPRCSYSSQTHRKKKNQEDFQLNGWESQEQQFWQDSNQKIIKFQ